MTKIEYAIDEIETALEQFEKASVPGGGGYSNVLLHCVMWENMWRAYANSLPRKKQIEFKQRADTALANALAG